MVDTWSKVQEFPNYSVSKDGKVHNDKRDKMKTPVVNRKGYYFVDLYENGKRSRKLVHRLVGEAYIDNPNNSPQINHKDGNKLNNNVDNLEWVTPSENMQHAFRTGLAKPSMGMLGKKNPNGGRKGKPIRIVETGEEFSSILECEKAINGNNRHICDCLSGRQKTHRGYTFEYIE